MGPKVEETLACVSWICSIPELIGTKAGLRADIFSYFKKIVALKPSIKKREKAQTLEMLFLIRQYFPTPRNRKFFLTRLQYTQPAGVHHLFWFTWRWKTYHDDTNLETHLLCSWSHSLKEWLHSSSISLPSFFSDVQLLYKGEASGSYS